MFCPQIFCSSAEKDDHVLEHFAQETCFDCDQNLIRIGSNLYTLHNSVTCIKRELKVETSAGYEFNAEARKLNDNGDNTPNNTTSKRILETQVDIKIEPNGVTDQLSGIEENSSQLILSQSSAQQNLSRRNCSRFEPKAPNKEGSKTDRAPCDICGESFHVNSLGRHKRLIHGGIECERIKCEVCKKVLRKQSIVAHMKMQHNSSVVKLKCYFCRRVFLYKSSLDNHLPQCSKNPYITGSSQLEDKSKNAVDQRIGQGIFYTDEHHIEQSQNDPVFDGKMATETSYVESFPQSINEKQNENSSATVQSVKAEPEEQNEELLVEETNNITDIYLNSNSNFQTQSTEIKGICEAKSQKKKTRKRRIKSHSFDNFDSFECDICKRVFRHKSAIRNHIRTKHDPNCTKFKCDYCGFGLMSQESLDNHLNKCKKALNEPSSNDRSCTDSGFVCEICGEMYPSQLNVKKHSFLVHNTGGHRCTNLKCKRIFFSVEALINHRLKCAELLARTFECYICHFVGSSKYTLITHMGRKHDKNSNKFKCDFCDRHFYRKYECENHKKKIHLKILQKKFTCSTCAREFTTKSTLKTHQNIHTGAKPFKCTFEGCECSFRDRSLLWNHQKYHRGEKRYRCKIDGCMEGFGGKLAFKRHKFNVHGVPMTKNT